MYGLCLFLWLFAPGQSLHRVSMIVGLFVRCTSLVALSEKRFQLLLHDPVSTLSSEENEPLKVCLYLSMPLHMHTLQEVIKTVPFAALHLSLDIEQLAQHDSSTWFPWVKWVLSLRSLQLIHLENNVCVYMCVSHTLFQHITNAHTKPKPIFISEQRVHATQPACACWQVTALSSHDL